MLSPCPHIKEPPYSFPVSSGDSYVYVSHGEKFCSMEKLIQGAAKREEELEKANARRLKHGLVHPMSQKPTQTEG